MKKDTELKAIKKLRKQLVWTTAAGNEILIKDMEMSHLQNTIVMLGKKQKDSVEFGAGDYEINDMKAIEWIEIFQDELKYRKRKN